LGPIPNPQSPIPNPQVMNKKFHNFISILLIEKIIKNKILYKLINLN
jgi:hypothetical protein